MAHQPPAPLAADRLYRAADLAALPFETSAELEAVPGLAGQARAHEAIRFGTSIGQDGFNIFAIGDAAMRLPEQLRRLLDEAARDRPEPHDWVYVYNFADAQRPVALRLPEGRAPQLQRAMHELVDDLRSILPSVFEGDDYQKRRGALLQSIQAKSDAAFAALTQKATAADIAILRTPMGFAMAPMKEGKVVPPAEFNAWPEEQKAAVQASIAELEKDLEETLRGMPRVEKEQRDAVRALDREVASFALAQPFEEAAAQFADLPRVLQHLAAMRDDVLDNVPLFASPEVAAQAGAPPPQVARAASGRLDGPFGRYDVNVMVTQAGTAEGAPVVEEAHPTLGNLVGRIEYQQMQGALVTNFRLIRAGALHRANGGTLLIDVRAILSEPFSWAALKRALLQRRVVIEDVARFVGLTTTVSLEPDPIPLDLKVVLFGDRYLYYLLEALDPDMPKHFKVLADFDEEIGRTAEGEALAARMVATLAREAGLRPLERAAVARMLEHMARLADDQAKLTLMAERVADVLAEADHAAAAAGRAAIARADIDAAIAARIRRAARLRDRSQEMILREIALIDTEGSRVGQINGLSVLSIGGFAFGRPSRITCRVRPGGGRILDIEREVKLGGPLHSKGVLILGGFLGSRFALDGPMSLSATLVFEQSYGGVDGDSASSAELYAMLSALSEMPLRQDLAVTGSVNQHGDVQAIGGVNEKIEGFFDICAARGLTGRQGVMIPQANGQHLMLREDVVRACAEGRFAIFPVSTIEQGIELLTGREAGVRGADGAWSEGSVFAAVEARLARFTRAVPNAGDDTARRPPPDPAPPPAPPLPTPGQGG
jgi:predicted ATP-dependent protease